MPAMETMPAKVKRNTTIANQRLSGKTYREIAALNGVDKSTVCRVLKRDEIKDVVDQGMIEMISRVPKGIDVIDQALNDYKNNPTISFKAGKFVLETATIAPTKAENQTINNIVNVQNNIGINPKVAQAMDNMFQSDDEDIIEAEIEGV